VIEEPLHAPPARSWRDIPQPVKPRAMSAGGRLRLGLALARTAFVVALVGGLAWGGWHVAGALRTSSKPAPPATKVPIGRVELQTATGGVLDDAWLKQTLALPKGISLAELDLEKLRGRLLASGQVLTATLSRDFPNRLLVQISERTPVARVRVGAEKQDLTYLVARDGFVYEGANYDPGMLNTLPWLAGFALKAEGAGFRPINGMGIVSDLLARAQYEATHLYLNWQVVSLERLETDHELEVTTKNGSRFVFTTRTDFFPQLAKLDRVLENLRDTEKFPGARSARLRINLSLGREVPVAFEPLVADAGPVIVAPPPPPPALSPGFNVFPSTLSQHLREL
jgi:cell division protein FtsQ